MKSESVGAIVFLGSILIVTLYMGGMGFGQRMSHQRMSHQRMSHHGMEGFREGATSGPSNSKSNEKKEPTGKGMEEIEKHANKHPWMFGAAYNNKDTSDNSDIKTYKEIKELIQSKPNDAKLEFDKLDSKLN